MSGHELEFQLRAHGIPIDSWGTGKSKTLAHLSSEIENGESILLASNEKLIRREEGVAVNIFYHSNNGVELKLFEEEQTFRDNRKRTRDFPFSLGEKMKTGESPQEAIIRALQEELGIDNPNSLVENVEFELQHNDPVPSTTYPGLFTERIIHVTYMELPGEYYKPEGYVEKQPDKTTIFKWHEV